MLYILSSTVALNIIDYSLNLRIFSGLRPQVSGGMDFKGHPARNVALVNATIDRIPFLKVYWYQKSSSSRANNLKTAYDHERSFVLQKP